MTPWWAPTRGASSDRSIWPTRTRSRCPCSMLVKRARLVFSQSCSVLRSVVSRKLSIIVLMLSFSSATSPRASTWIERVRSPLVTAVATSAIARARGHLIGEGRQGVGHVVDRLGQGRDLALRLDREVLLQVAVGDRGHDLH